MVILVKIMWQDNGIHNFIKKCEKCGLVIELKIRNCEGEWTCTTKATNFNNITLETVNPEY